MTDSPRPGPQRRTDPRSDEPPGIGVIGVMVMAFVIAVVMGTISFAIAGIVELPYLTPPP